MNILKMFISRGGFEGGDPLLNDVQWICVYLRGLVNLISSAPKGALVKEVPIGHPLTVRPQQEFPPQPHESTLTNSSRVSEQRLLGYESTLE